MVLIVTTEKNGVLGYLSAKVLPYIIVLGVTFLGFQGTRIINALDNLTLSFQKSEVATAIANTSQASFEREMRASSAELKAIATGHDSKINDHEIRIRLLEKRL